MFGLDEWLARLGENGAMPLLLAVILGLRHATDPDHLTAVSTLVLGDRGEGPRRAGTLGLAWGLGHATTLVAFGLPVLLFRRLLPGPVTRGAEFGIGVVIVVLAARLLIRWMRGHYHSHPHTHDGVAHAHPHIHEGFRPHDHHVGHTHTHADSLGRSPVAAYGIGLVHGLGGSAGVGILVAGAGSGRLDGVAALVLFAVGTAVSMAVVSSAFAYALAREAVARRITSLVPLAALASLVFGTFYALNALGGVPLLLTQ